MFIQNIRIDRFGSVANLAIDNLTQEITVIHGVPGTGKTTLLQFAQAILYGLDAPGHVQHLPSINPADFGGSITWSWDHQNYTIRRCDDSNVVGQIDALDDSRPTRAALAEVLQGVSADLYSRLFAVDFSHRPEVSKLLDEAENCGFNIQGQVIDTAKMQELVGRLATLQSTMATFGPVGQSLESLQMRRRELVVDIARMKQGTTQQQDERSQPESQPEPIERHLTTARQELHALREAIDEVAAVRQGSRARLTTVKTAAENSRTRETEIRDLDAQIERWKGVLRELATRYEAVGQRVLAAMSSRTRDDEFDADLFAVETNCDFERKQLTRVQAELQVSLRYLEEERDTLVAICQPAQSSSSEITRVKQQFKQLDEKKVELQQRFDEVSEVIRKSECELETLQHRQQGLTTDMAARPTLNRELQEIETLLSEIERRKTLVESIAETQRQIRRLEEGSGESSILRTATSYLRRISADDLQRIEVSHGKHVWVSDAKGNRLSWSHLTDGARDMVYLTLCLALVEAQDQRKIPLPSIWKDLFTNFDSRHVPETAALLCEFAHEGRQILLLTRHEHVASVFEFMDVPSHRLVATQDGPTSHSPHHDQLPTRDLSLLRSAPGETTVTDVDSATTPNEDREVDSNFFLFAESPIERSPALSADDAVRLRRLGLTTVGELLQVSGDDIAAELSYAEVSSRMVADWQSQALMMCHVAHLREYDARILVACGITDPSHLNQISPVEVRAMIERFAASGEGRATLLSGTEFELSRVTDWVRIAASPDRQQQQPTGNNTNRQDGRQADVVRMNPTLETHDLQYYLEDSSNVVDAPSIGQRSAERLETVGIVTVSDLLAADPIELAGRLKNGRMKTKLIVTWQQQSTLVCRVPKLRGHDAQILVAIGVTDAEELAAMEPQELWSKVEPFAESTAGKRIIRSSKTPDFEEVFHWIEWASLARTLNAA